jgi:hypothetical protein
LEASSDPICSSAGCTQYKHKKTPLGYPINYGVPNFGVDGDIIDSKASVEQAQEDLGHNWEFGTKASKARWHNKAKDTLYDFAPHLDGDMQTTAKNLKDAQTNLNHKWVIEEESSYKPNYLQLDAETSSDPICSSAGCTQYKHKKTPLGYALNYPVPNNGVDRDIIDSHASLADAQANLGHEWEFGTKASKAKWHNVAKDTLYDFAPKLTGDMITTAKNLQDSQTKLGHKWVIEEESSYKPNYIQLESKSDPICSSSGCEKSKYTEEEEAKIVQYPDPSLLDSDIRHTLKHEGAASVSRGHVWIP